MLINPINPSPQYPILQFPSKENIINSLQKHPLIKNLSSNILQGVAEHFANQGQSPQDIELGVMLTMCELKSEIPKEKSTEIQKNLTIALRECARWESIILGQ